MKLNIKACALAGAIVWGGGLFIITWWLIAFGQATPETAALIGQVYLGYDISLAGSFIGLFWGFIDGLFGGFFFGLLYNFFARRIPDET